MHPFLSRKCFIFTDTTRFAPIGNERLARERYNQCYRDYTKNHPMGLLILPFLLLAFVISIASTILWVNNVVKNQIRLLEFILGIGLTFILYSLIVLAYKIAGSGWALGPMFIIPIVMFLVPFALYLGLSNSKDVTILNIRNAPLISITFTAILAIVFYDNFFDFFQYFGIEKNY